MSEKKEVSKKGSSTKIVLNRQSDLILTGATIETPVGIVLEDIKGVEEAFKKEASTREKADAKLQDQIDNVLSNVDPESLDSLTEIVAAFEGADKDLNGAIKDLSMAASKALDAEAKEREEADAQEAKAREEADANEADARKEADSTEAKERQSADKKEASTRAKADANLQDQIDNVLSNIDPKSLDSLTEIVAAFEAADKDLNGAIKDLSLAASKALDKVEENLESKIADIISNTDLTAIDSFTEVVQRVDSEYYQKLDVNETPDGTIVRFTFSTWSRSSSESIFLNGLLLTEKEDYTIVSVSKNIAAVDFIVAPEVGDRVKAYGVYATDAVSISDINAKIAKLEMELQESQDKMNSSKANLESVKNNLDRTTAEMNMVSEEIAKLQENLDYTNSDVVKSQEGIAESQNLLAEAQASDADLNVSIAEYEKAIAEAQANKANTEAEKAQYLADGGDDQAIIDGYDSTIASANAILAESQASLMNARAQKAENDSMIEEFQNRLNQYNEELKAAIEKLNMIASELASATESYSSFQADVAEAEAKIAHYTEVIVGLEAIIAKGKDNLATLQKQLADLEAAFGGGHAS